MPKANETSIDVIGYAAQIASLIGAHIIKVKVPDETVFSKKVQEKYTKYSVKLNTIESRIAHIKQSAFANRRIVVFSGGAAKDEEILLNEIKGIKKGGGNGSIIGRNVFQRHKSDALEMLNKILDIYAE